MDKNLRYRDKKGLSTIVVTVILIALSMAAIVLVWAFVSNLVKGQIKSSESCFGNYDKVQINDQYTCYTKSGSDYNLRFSLNIGDIDVEKVLVSISSASSVKSFGITNDSQVITGLEMYPSGSTDVSLPGKNSGVTYNVTTMFSDKIDLIRIAPVINKDLCEVSDSVSEIEDCALLV
jgi:hypothetical protein